LLLTRAQLYTAGHPLPEPELKPVLARLDGCRAAIAVGFTGEQDARRFDRICFIWLDTAAARTLTDVQHCGHVGL